MVSASATRRRETATAAAGAAPALEAAGSPSPLRDAESPIIMDWEISTAHGWGLFGLHLALQLIRQGRGTPALLVPPDLRDATPVARALLHPAAAAQPVLAGILSSAGGQVVDTDYPAIRGLGPGLRPAPDSLRVRSPRNAGVTFLEDTAIPDEARAWGNACDVLIAGSRWTGAMLEGNGLKNVRTVQQGIDPAVFHPARRSGLLDGRFVVFSGGKLEYRKGQDLVVAAFRIFVQRHPEALLVAAWHNPWPGTVAGVDCMEHVRGVPTPDGAGGLRIEDWLVANGIPAGNLLVPGPVPNPAMALLLRDADLAVFPNRCEGGTNLVAMEAMATGVPCILSANTGHLDLIQDGNCYPLTLQRPVAGGCPLYQGYEGWGESDVGEIVELMERAFTHRAEARARGTLASEWMLREWTWETRMTDLLDVLAEHQVL